MSSASGTLDDVNRSNDDHYLCDEVIAMSISTSGWKNKSGTGARSCRCGTWADHWVKFAKKQWPATCSVEACASRPTLGGHVVNPGVAGERIVPMCDSCNGLTGTFSLKNGTTVPSANTAETCGT